MSRLHPLVNSIRPYPNARIHLHRSSYALCNQHTRFTVQILSCPEAPTGIEPVTYNFGSYRSTAELWSRATETHSLGLSQSDRHMR
jgi:hypothetical protein